MGKVKRQAQKHSNHHDNPRKGNTSISRRQHSQKPPAAVKKSASRPASRGNPQGRFKVPFAKFDNVLLVGEVDVGDFSFSLSLKQHHKVNQITATCYDSRETLESKYPNVAQTVRQLAGLGHESPTKKISRDESDSANADVTGEDTEWNGFSSPPSPSTSSTDDGTGETTSKIPKVNVLYGIDATKLFSAHKKALRAYSPFTKIAFNFPHVGGLSTDVNRQVRYNQELLVGFFKGAKELLSTPTRPAMVIKSDTYDEDDEFDDIYENETHRDPGAVSGQILVTLFEGEPYTLWNIRDLARHSSLKVVESFKFPWSAYPGYQHARTIGDINTGKDRSEQGKIKGAWRGEERDARCYVLEDKDAEVNGQASKKRKKRDYDSDGENGD